MNNAIDEKQSHDYYESFQLLGQGGCNTLVCIVQTLYWQRQ